MKRILLLLTLSVITSAAFSQNTKKCGTQDQLDELIQKDPSILQKIKENREKNQEWIKRNGSNKENSKYNYPAIPGFVPTGDFATDRVNFQNAKSNLTGKDIEVYKEIISEHQSKESIRKRREMIEQKNQEPKKQ